LNDLHTWRVSFSTAHFCQAHRKRSQRPDSNTEAMSCPPISRRGADIRIVCCIVKRNGGGRQARRDGRGEASEGQISPTMSLIHPTKYKWRRDDGELRRFCQTAASNSISRKVSSYRIGMRFVGEGGEGAETLSEMSHSPDCRH
jgi:hypothetical protein